MTSLLPKFQELHDQKEIKFLLATNNIDDADSAMRRSGRIDLILPMGPIYWKDRLDYLKKLSEKNENVPQKFYEEFSELKNFDKSKITRNEIVSKSSKKFLIMTDYMPVSDFRDFAREIVNYVEQGDKFENLLLSNAEEFELYMDNELEDFHNSKLIGDNKKYIRYPLIMRKEIDHKRGINIIIGENNFLSFILSTDQLKKITSEELNGLKQSIEKHYEIIKNKLEERYNLEDLERDDKLLKILNFLVLYPSYLLDEEGINSIPLIKYDKNINDIRKKIIEDKNIGQRDYKRERYDMLVINRLTLEKLFPQLIKPRSKCDIICKYKIKLRAATPP